MNLLSKWSWSDIHRVYESFADEYLEIKRLSNSVGVKELKINLDYDDFKNIFILRALQDMRKLDRQIAILDKEIARRSKLIGVI